MHACTKKPSLEMNFQYILKNIKYILNKVKTKMLICLKCSLIRETGKEGSRKFPVCRIVFKNKILFYER